MTYLQEFRAHWRALLSSTIGHGAGLAVSAYIIGTFAPPLMAEFGWSRADFALLGTATLLTVVCLPVIGRITDLFGVRRVATVGVVFMPLSYLALSTFDGQLHTFIAITILQVLFGTTTTSTVYSRLVAERFERARGMGLAIMASGPALIGAIAAPLLSDYIDEQGWRAAYRLMAVLSAGFGALALLLIPRQVRPVILRRRSAPRDYTAILRNPAFWVIAGGMFLCNLPQPLHGAQLKLMLLDNGLDSASASGLISLYAIGVLIGRFACGLALDRLPAHWVAACSMGLPSLGMLLIASSYDAYAALGAAVLLMGLSQGAEGDIAGYLVVRHFGLEVYSSVLGLVIAALGVASAIGAMTLSASLAASGHYVVFLKAGAIGVLMGAALFAMLGHARIAGPRPAAGHG